MQGLLQETLLVQPEIGLLNRFAQKAQSVAITGIEPIFRTASQDVHDAHRLLALRIQVEGPSNGLNKFHQLLTSAQLNFQA